jgi:glyoxylase-like metal-dependent hydrolase (beta-lactamase superfamily II)
MITKRNSTVALVLAAALGLCWFISYRPILVEGIVPAAGPYTLPPAVPGLRLFVFNTGANRMSSLLVGGQRPWRPVPAMVISHPQEGLIVFDTGLSDAVARDGEVAMPIPMRWLFESRGRPEHVLDAQMIEAGVDPARVRWLIVSHLHDDHVGRIGAFPAATVIGGPGSGTHAEQLGLKGRWREITSEETSRPLLPFDGALDLFNDGSLLLIRGGGHAREDLMVLLSLPEGPVVLAGDAAVHRDWVESDDVQRIATDPARAATVRNQIRAIEAAFPRLVILFGHDLSDLPSGRSDITLHAPERFSVESWPISP